MRTRQALWALMLLCPMPGCRAASTPPPAARPAAVAAGQSYSILHVSGDDSAGYVVSWGDGRLFGGFGTVKVAGGPGWEARAHAAIRAELADQARQKAAADALRKRVQDAGGLR